MNFLKGLMKKHEHITDETEVMLIITKRLKPWIVLNCLERENYLITDNLAEQIANIILKQAVSLNVLDKVIANIKLRG